MLPLGENSQRWSIGVIERPNCGRKNHQEEKITIYCGSPLSVEHAATRALDETDYEEGRPHWGTARFNSRMCLIINERDSRNKHVFYFDEIEELIIGRV